MGKGHPRGDVPKPAYEVPAVRRELVEAVHGWAARLLRLRVARLPVLRGDRVPGEGQDERGEGDEHPPGGGVPKVRRRRRGDLRVQDQAGEGEAVPPAEAALELIEKGS